MSKSKGLGITGAVFGALAAAFGLLAQANYRSAMEYSGPARWGGRQAAQDISTVPTVIAFICLGAAVLCVVLAVAAKPSDSDPPQP